ncbi:type I 3-dehydroquinate dehydratase [Listeria weihenstephanensis]|uniref:3-dehydroquinate dehydratase n=1 Tax=Listeria weihenstephanensis TaxID=1006155 RepID=A0A841Z4Z1_9LIST|nr:type I 3-dehydroquinate dehydratase [Listeria weihenstephanensis]MBC1499722.1 type I 3-dehydroquinate dehydratase [Listeria weihenstephanensis]
MKSVAVRDIVIGEGAPSICVPMVGVNSEQLLEEARMLVDIDLDVVEWRVDFYEDVADIAKVKNMLREIRSILGNIPIIFTFRSAKEGGEREFPVADYVALNKEVAATGMADIVDVELFTGDQEVAELVVAIHAAGAKVIMSNHDFAKTPAEDEIVSRLVKMQDIGADLPKIAVMPQSPADVLTLLSATNTMREKFADRPIVTMSMAGTGVVSRLAGEIFGSALTFGAAKKASAPGQVAVDELRQVLDLLHKSLN